MSRVYILCPILCGLLFLSSCISTKQIETASPRPGFLPFSGNKVAELGALSMTVTTGASALPEEIQVLQFRINEVQLKTREGEWNSIPVELNNFEIVSNRVISKDILSTRVQAVAYDSIAIYLSDVFVLFGENSGGPVAWPRDRPIKDKIDIAPTPERSTRIKLVFEPGASVTKDDDCRWYFIPFWHLELGNP